MLIWPAANSGCLASAKSSWLILLFIFSFFLVCKFHNLFSGEKKKNSAFIYFSK